MKLRFLVLFVAMLVACPAAWAGSIFLTGHDPDFHAQPASNTTGARNINNAAIDFILDPLANPFAAGGVTKFLFVESNIPTPGGHRVGETGIVQSGFVAGTDFDNHDASTLNAALNGLGTTYGGIVIASDFGGLLTQAELDILIARSSDIMTFLDAGGGLYAMAESNNGAGLTPGGGHFSYLPFITTSTSFNQSEVGFTVTPFGASLGLSDSDVNGNASHNVFNSTFGLNVVDFDADNRIMSLAGRGALTAPEFSGTLYGMPNFGWMAGLGFGLVGLAVVRRRQNG